MPARGRSRIFRWGEWKRGRWGMKVEMSLVFHATKGLRDRRAYFHHNFARKFDSIPKGNNLCKNLFYVKRLLKIMLRLWLVGVHSQHPTVVDPPLMPAALLTS